MEDFVRVLRVIEYTGPRDIVEKQLLRSMKPGTHNLFPNGLTIKIAQLDEFPEIVNKGEQIDAKP
jgi:hypothetical protein